jgi:putative hydrolase of HD superfamily
MSLMAVLIEPLLKQKVDTARLLKMIILHDLVEAEATDISALDVLRNPEIRVDKVEKKKKQLKIYAWLYRTQMDKKFMTYFMNLKKRKLTKQKLQTLWTS